jgi:hypothetical protein
MFKFESIDFFLYSKNNVLEIHFFYWEECPREGCPRGGCPRGGCPRGGCPKGEYLWEECSRGECTQPN